MKNALLLSGITLLSLVLFFVLFLFTYPVFFTEQFESVKQEVEEQFREQSAYFDAVEFLERRFAERAGVFEFVDEQISESELADLREETEYFAAKNDSLIQVIESMKQSHESEIAALRNRVLPAFSEEHNRSLLNLDDEELRPILSQLSEREIQAIYADASNMQREKLLRNLAPARAARLLSAIIE